MIRLYVQTSLAAGEAIEVSAAQAHYLGSVMRKDCWRHHSACSTAATVNGSARITALARGKAILTAEDLPACPGSRCRPLVDVRRAEARYD